MLSWNINGNILKKLCFIEEFTLNFDIIWMHEHSLNDVTKELTTPMSYFFDGARCAGNREIPSGGLAILARIGLPAVIVNFTSTYLAFQTDNSMIANIYVPIDYRNDKRKK